ncbi:hypothetical protein C8F04DRAFT_1177185 [Mycena alexandri]|uniref:Uncharacterized protein n=1 Tax=Mycena alexandri TaxID=1745969 RepID=A0AAD6TCD5_9AGAR|nr:hypothetical protein C8F04DRAFT_1177185 [Mycena alexandri]
MALSRPHTTALFDEHVKCVLKLSHCSQRRNSWTIHPRFSAYLAWNPVSTVQTPSYRVSFRLLIYALTSSSHFKPEFGTQRDPKISYVWFIFEQAPKILLNRTHVRKPCSGPKKSINPRMAESLQRMISSVHKDIHSAVPLDMFRIRISIANFVRKAGVEPAGEDDYVLVTVPRCIIGIATRDLSLQATDNILEFESDSDYSDDDKENIPSCEFDVVESITDLTGGENEEQQLQNAHSLLGAQGVIDLTD